MKLAHRNAAAFLAGMLSTGLLLVLLVGILMLGGCSSGAAPTPTPTKTPTPPAAQGTPTPLPDSSVRQPTDTPDTGSQGGDPTATPVVDTPTPAGETATPTVAGPTSTPVPPTATPRPQPSGPATMRSPDFGAQAFLWWRPDTAERDLRLMKEAGFNWVKQWFAWQDIEGAGRNQYDWSRSDRIVDQVNTAGLKLLVRVSPTEKRFWAGDPPENAGLFAEFVGALAARYRGRIHAYQVWNEPNLAREWGDKPPDPAGYARLLGQTYRAIKSADPNAIVVTAGMAPTTADIDIAMYDTKFYREMYAAMGGNSNGYFDALGVHGAGYAVAPETDPGRIASDPRLYNNDPSPAERLRVYSFRHVEDIRQIMVENGDSGKQIVILEFGWTFDPRQGSPYYWHGAGAGIDPQVQGDYLVRAYQYADQNWSWIGLMSLIYMPDAAWTPDTEQYYWSIMDPSPPGETYWRPAYIKLCIYMNQAQGRQCPYDPSR